MHNTIIISIITYGGLGGGKSNDEKLCFGVERDLSRVEKNRESRMTMMNTDMVE